LIDDSDIEVDMDLTASDIVVPQIGFIKPDMTLREAAMELHRYHSDSLPVVDDDKNFLGDISCYDLFSYGLPRFFSKLKTISFLKHMDPFEKYFHIEASVKIKSLLNKRESPVISPDATLMEIIFEMTTNNRQVVYVVKDGKMLGIIDRYNIIDKILIAG
jgi:CBS domain-containing protein